MNKKKLDEFIKDYLDQLTNECINSASNRENFDKFIFSAPTTKMIYDLGHTVFTRHLIEIFEPQKKGDLM